MLLACLVVFCIRKGGGRERDRWSFWAENEGGAGKCLQVLGTSFAYASCSRAVVSIQPCRYIILLYGSMKWKLIETISARQIVCPKCSSTCCPHARCVPCLAAPILTCIDTVPVTCSRLYSGPVPLPVMSCSHCRPVLKPNQHDMCQLLPFLGPDLTTCLPPLEAFDALFAQMSTSQLPPSQAAGRTTPPHEREVKKLGNGNNVDDLTGTMPPRKRSLANIGPRPSRQIGTGLANTIPRFRRDAVCVPSRLVWSLSLRLVRRLPWPWPWIYTLSPSKLSSGRWVVGRGGSSAPWNGGPPDRRGGADISFLPTIPLYTITCWPRPRGGGGGGRTAHHDEQRTSTRKSIELGSSASSAS